MDTLKCDDIPNQDPDYFTPINKDFQSRNIIEENARDTANKISAILETEFSKEINAKKQEIFDIYKNLNKACKMLHYLRFAIVTDFYNQENTYIDKTQLQQSRLHSTVNSAIKKVFDSDVSCMNKCFQKLNNDLNLKRKSNYDSYVPVKKCLKSSVPSVQLVGTRGKIKKRIVIANISQWIPPDSRENNSATHKWTIFIRDSEKSDCSQFISKVRYFLHPSYKPNDVIELTSAPFDLSRLGWGEFPARIQLHFINNFDKPIDIIHHIKLDRTFTCLKTIGSQTVVDLWLSAISVYNDNSIIEISEQEIENEKTATELKTDTNLLKAKSEENTKLMEIPNLWHLYNDHNYIGRDFKFHEYFHHEFEKLQTSKSYDFNNIELMKENLVHKPLGQKGISLLKSKQKDLNTFSTTYGKQANNKEYGTHHIFINNRYHLLYKENVPDDFDGKKMYVQQENKTNKFDNHKDIINLIQRIQPKTLFGMLKIIVPKIPLITEESTNPLYKIAHPYATESFQVFNNYPEVKQRSLERCQALHALDIMRTAKSDVTCSVKELMTWARRFSYTPILNMNTIHKLSISDALINVEEDVKKYESTSTMSNELNKWLSGCQKTIPHSRNFEEESDEIIDVLNDLPSTSNSMSININFKEEIVRDKQKMKLLNYPEKQKGLSDFVCKTSQKIGIKLNSEEIVPNYLHDSVNLVITKAMECMIDDLVRLSFSCALDRSNAQKDTVSIEYEDVRMALLKKEEFDIFTNAGLGSEG